MQGSPIVVGALEEGRGGACHLRQVPPSAPTSRDQDGDLRRHPVPPLPDICAGEPRSVFERPKDLAFKLDQPRGVLPDGVDRDPAQVSDLD